MDSAPTVNGETLKQIRLERRLLQEQILLARLKQSNRLLEAVQLTDYWMEPYSETMDRAGIGRWSYYPITKFSDRQSGKHFPFWQDHQQLSMIRAQARLLLGTNCYARGILNGLTSYVIGNGLTYRAAPKKNSRLDANTDLALSSPERQNAKALVDKVQRVIDGFCRRNKWPQLERELFQRSRRDGEYFVRYFPTDNGNLNVRTIEPEQIVQPDGTQFEEWGFGIQTDPEDVLDVKAFNAVYLADGRELKHEQIDPSEVHHCKINVDSVIKRGFTDFAFETYSALEIAGKLRRNMGEGAAVQAAIAAVRQHEAVSLTQVSDFKAALADYSRTDAITGKTRDYEKIEPGSFLDIPKGMNYVPPPGWGPNASYFVEILQACLRAACVPWNAPEWLASAYSQEVNFASSLTAESPFVKTCEYLQAFYEDQFGATIKRAVQVAIDAGELPGETLELVEIQVEAPVVQTRDRLQESQVNQAYLGMRLKSPQTISQEQGWDYDQEQVNIEEHSQRTGGPGPSPMDQDQGDQNAFEGMEGLLEADDALSRKIAKLRNEGHPEDQAVAIAYSMKRRGELEGATKEADKETAECGGEGGKPGPCPTDGAADEKATSILMRAKQLPGALKQKALATANRLKAGLEQRYGPKWAKAIVSSAAASLAVPVPGAQPATLAAMFAAAETHRLYRKIRPTAGADLAAEITLSPEQVAGLGKEFLAAIRAAMGAGDIEECGGEGGEPGPCPTGKKKPAAKGRGKASGPIDPMSGHPHAGKSKEEIAFAISKAIELDRGGKRVIPSTGSYANYQPKAKDADKIASEVVGAVQAQEKTDAFTRPTIKGLYDRLRAEHPDLSISDFHGILGRMAAGGKIALKPYTQALATHPNPEHLFPLDGEAKYYVQTR